MQCMAEVHPITLLRPSTFWVDAAQGCLVTSSTHTHLNNFFFPPLEIQFSLFFFFFLTFITFALGIA